jgi:two-component sensor histidine kinase
MTVKTRAFLPASAVERSIVVLLSLGFILLMIVVVASTASVIQTRKFNNDVNHAQLVRALARNVLTDTIDVETGARGYLLTSQKDYLDVYNRALDRLSAEMNALQREATRDPKQLRRVATLKIHIDARVAQIKRSVAFVAAGRAAEAVAEMKKGDDHEEMTRIRDLIREIDRVEGALLAKRSRQAESADTLTLVINVASTLLVIVVGVVTGLMVSGYIHRLRDSRAELDRVNQQLEHKVHDRTRDLVRANKDIRVARDRAETLLKEVNHRIGNSLQLASSFIAMQARSVKSEAARAALRGTQSRLEAVAHIHRSLYTSDDVTVVELDEYLAGLVEALQGSLAPYPGGPKVTFKAEPLRAPTDRAVSLGVILAELVTNAVKYAYAADSGGEIRVRLLSPGEHRGILVVEDDGQGMKGGAPKGTGLGQRIIDAMAANLHATMEYDTHHKGVRATLAFQL